MTGSAINYGRSKLLIAYHEAGHAVAARALGISIAYASLADLYGRSLVLTRSASYGKAGDDLDALERDAIVLLAGPMAQLKHQPVSSREQERAWEDGGAFFEDKQRALNFLGLLLLQRAGEPIPGAGEVLDLRGERVQQVYDMLNQTIPKAEALVDQHWRAIRRVAKSLTRDEVLIEAEIDALIAA
jgi:hypothetical protein